MINLFVNQWFDFMVNNFLQLTTFLVIIAFIGLIFKKSSPLFLYYLWTIGYLIAILPPKINIPIFTESFSIPTLYFPIIEIFNSPDSSSISYKIVLFFLWIFVVIFLFLRQIIQEQNLNEKLSDSEIADFSNIVLDLKNKMKVRKKIRIYFSEYVTIPFIRSFSKPKIYLPLNAKEWKEQELYTVLAHEIAHIKRNDNIHLIIISIINFLFFFNPMLWFAREQLNLQREKICDEMTINVIKGKSTDYGKYLLSNLENYFKMKTANIFMVRFLFSKKSLIQRFEYILNRKEENMLKLKTVHKVVLVLIILSGLFYTNCANLKNNSISNSSKFVTYDEAPKLVEKVNPEYPEEERKSGIEGKVWLEIEVKDDGTVGKVEIKENKTGSDLLAVVSIEAIKNWVFEPAKKDGKPVRCWVTFPVVFLLE